MSRGDDDAGPSRLREEIRQTRPFRSRSQEAAIAVLRTADELRRHFSDVVEPHGVTLQQFNVLRILRGARGEPLPTLEIGERLIERTPGVTRLIDRLEEKGLVRRERSSEDRRRVDCSITEAGLALLADLDEVVNEADEVASEALEEGELGRLVELLDRLRGALNPPGRLS